MLELLGARGDRPDDDAQSDMFEAEAPLPLPVKGSSGPKGGRPKGARNRSTAEWVQFFLAQHRAPLSVLGNIVSMSVADLTAELQRIADERALPRRNSEGEIVGHTATVINPLDVLKLIRDTATALAPYIHQQQPKALEIANKPRGVMIMDLGAEDAETVGVDDLALPLAKVIENQEVEKVARVPSDSEPSDMSRKDNGDNGLAFVDT